MGTLTHTKAGHVAAGAARPRVVGCPSPAGHPIATGMVSLPAHGIPAIGIQGTTVKPGATWAYDRSNRFARRRWELSP